LLWTLAAPLRAQPASTAAAHIELSSRTAAVGNGDGLVGRFKDEKDPLKRLEVLQQLSIQKNHSEAGRLLLTHALSEDYSDKVRTAAGAALLSYDGEQPVRALEAALGTEQGEGVRLGLCAALSSATVRPDDALVAEALSQLLTQDANASVRLCAVKGLDARGDRRALAALNAAASHDESPAVRKEAKKAFAALFAPPKAKPAPKPKARPLETVDETGHLHCGADAGVCQCTNGVITPRAHCLLLEDCRHLYETSYQNEGNFECTWDGQDVEQQR